MGLNGGEIGGGSLRIYNADLQEKVFESLGLTPEQAHAKFGFMMDAFQYGTPPHGGLAFGLDRRVSSAAGTTVRSRALYWCRGFLRRCIVLHLGPIYDRI